MPLPLTTGAGPCYRDVLRRVWGSPPTRCSLQTRAAGRSQISGRLFPHPRRMRRALSYCCRACITGAAPSQTRADGGSSLRPPPFLTQRKAVLQRNWQGGMQVIGCAKIEEHRGRGLKLCSRNLDRNIPYCKRYRLLYLCSLPTQGEKERPRRG